MRHDPFKDDPFFSGMGRGGGDIFA